MLKQILWSLGRLFQEKYTRYLERFHKPQLFPRSRESLSYQETTVDLIWCISSLFNM